MQEKKKPSNDDHIPWYIKVFGSTILIIAFSLTSLAFQQCFSGISTVSGEVRGCVRQSDHDATKKAQWDAIRRLETEIGSLREENSKLRERVSILEKIKGTP